MSNIVHYIAVECCGNVQIHNTFPCCCWRKYSFIMFHYFCSGRSREAFLISFRTWVLRKTVSHAVNFSHVGTLIFSRTTTGDVWIIPFSNLGLCAACWARFMCHHELWPTSLCHPFLFLNSSFGLAGGERYQKITIPVLRLVPQNFALPGCFYYIIFYRYLFFLLSAGLFVIVVCGFMSVQGTS